jgi:hypothetical protein
MGELNIGNSVASDLASAETNFSITPYSTDGVSDTKETIWTNEKWTTYLGYYKKIPELKIAIDAKAKWSIGKGFLADPEVELVLNNISGFGKDSFNRILENMLVTSQIGGDAYAEIIIDKNGRFRNLKPLDPETMIHIADNKGLLLRYEQSGKGSSINKKYDTNQIFHLTRNRIADEIHGTSDIEAVEDIILMRNEAMADYKKLMHRHVVPRMIYKLDTDDPTQIANFKAKEDKANADGENIYIPQGAVETEVLAISANSTLSPLAWIDQLNKYFFQATGVPSIIVGGSSEFTEASAKIAYLAWQQTVEEIQLYVEEQVLSQLNIEINLEFPASLEQEALSDKPKQNQDGSAVNQPQIQQNEQAIEPNDQQAELEGNR